VGVPVGFTLQPDERFLAETTQLALAGADYFEVAPETLWRFDDDGRMAPNGFFDVFLELGRRHGKRFVAHGVGWSPGSAVDRDGRRARWLDAIARTHDAFCFDWYSDHLGATVWDGQELVLPLAVPMDAEAAQRSRAHLQQLQSVVPDVGLENTVAYFLFGDPLDEPAFLRDVLAGERLHLVLDLHNVYTMALNMGFDAADYIDRLPLERVVEMHVSGGSASDPAWMPDGSVLRLDSHDSAVPEAVFDLLVATLPRCPNLRGVTLERMEGTVGDGDADVLERELARLRELCMS
jgi:uncharacterized protein (UPF0276 family)